MIIQKINNVLVKHGKVTFGIFTAVIIVSFVWFFTPGRDGSMLFDRSAGMGTAYGAVLGHNVTYGDITNANQIVRMFRAAGYGLSPQRIQGPDEDESFQYAVLLKAADVLNVQASDSEVRDVIRTLPTFQVDGKFSNEAYTQYKDRYLAPSGLGFSDLEEAIRSIIRLQKVPMITAANVVVSDAEAQTSIESMLQKITYHLITFDPDSFEDQVTVDETELKDFYAANPSLFMSEPESDGLLVFAPYTEKKTEVPEEQIKEYYELRKALFVKEDGTEMAYDEVKDDIRKELEVTVDRDEAIAKVQAFNIAFRADLKSDKEEGNPEDPQKHFREEAEKAGLRIIEMQNITAHTEEATEFHIDHELIEAVGILKNPGSYTNYVIGEDGVSMFLMTARRPSVVQPFDDVKDVARKRLVSQKERALAEEASAQFGLKFMELKNPHAEIEELVKSLKGTWHAESSRARFEIEGNPYMPAVNEILTTAPGKLSAPDKQFGYPVFVFVSSHTPATAEEIAEQKDLLTREVKYRKQEIASRGLQNWVLGSAQIFARRGQNQE